MHLSAGTHILRLWIPDVNRDWILKMRRRKNLQTQAWSCRNSTEVKAEEDIQIKHLYDKHMILIFVLIMVWSCSKDWQRTRGLDMLCLTVGDRTLIYRLKSRKLGRSGYHLCRGNYIYEDKNTQKLIQKKRRARCQKNLFSNHVSICLIDNSCKNHSKSST